MPLFDAAASEARKLRGMETAAAARETDLDKARAIAREIASRHGTVNADEVGQMLFTKHGIKTLGPAAGSLFKGGEFEMTGDYVKSTRKKNHSRLLAVWRLKAT